MEEITQDELNERIALLKKFRSLLLQQRQKFQDYLTVLEKQESSIENEDPEALLIHTELEKQVVSNIETLQKVIVPMSEIYKTRGAHLEEDSVNEIRNDLGRLQKKVIEQNQKNQDLLRRHMTTIRTQISNLKNPYKTARSIYAEKSTVGSLIAVEV